MQPCAGKKPVVLVVEDEPLVRAVALAAVAAAACDVIEAANADEAIAILGQRTDIHLIFTDINMPGSMDGLKLTHLVSDRWPHIKIVATSGQARISEQHLPQGGRFLPKPYKASQVANSLHELIHGPRFSAVASRRPS